MLTQRLLYVFRRLVVHLVLLSGCFVAAYLVHFEGRIPEPQKHHLLFSLSFGVGTMVLGLLWARVYRKMSDFVSLRDFISMLRGTALATLTLLCANSLMPPAFAIPWPVLLVYFLLSTAMLSVSLFTLRIWRESPLGQAQRFEVGKALRPVLIYGAGRAGSMVAREILGSPELGYELRGFIDDDPEKWGKEIHGVRVLGGRQNLAGTIGPDLREIVLAIPSLEAGARREILTWCRRSGGHVRIVPGLAELLRETSVVLQIRDVRVEDLLPRDAVELDETQVNHLLEKETVLVTGAAGSIGSELCHQILLHRPATLLLVEQSESRLFYLERELEEKLHGGKTTILPLVADIGDRDRMEMILKRFRPAHIFHAAAYKHVPMMEHNPYEAIQNNILGTYCVAQLAKEYEVQRFTLVSTDKAVEPTSVMGASKRAAEIIVRELNRDCKTQFVMVRFGNVLDSDGSVVPLFKQQIAAGGPITITHPDMERFFMTIPEAARLILQATAMGQGGEVFVLEMGKPVRILDLARSLVELSGLRFMEDIQVQFSGPRPGEKLSEKLFFDHERSESTKVRQIYRARLENGHRVDVPSFLATLREMLATYEDPYELGLRFMTLMRQVDAPVAHGAPQAQSGTAGSPETQIVPMRRMGHSGA